MVRIAEDLGASSHWCKGVGVGVGTSERKGTFSMALSMPPLMKVLEEHAWTPGLCLPFCSSPISPAHTHFGREFPLPSRSGEMLLPFKA